jgi:hypothetical protein
MMNFEEARKHFAEQVLQTGGATLRVVRNEKEIQGFELPPDTGYMVSYKLTEERDFLVFRLEFEVSTIYSAEKMFSELVRLDELSIDGYHNLFSEDDGVGSKIAMDVEYIGAWIDQGSLIGDYSKHFDTLGDAIAFGKANEQAAIYDLANKTSIYL